MLIPFTKWQNILMTEAMEEQTLYKVVRYFDNYAAGTEARNLTFEEAKRIRFELASRNHKPYTSFEICKEE